MPSAAPRLSTPAIASPEPPATPCPGSAKPRPGSQPAGSSASSPRCRAAAHSPSWTANESGFNYTYSERPDVVPGQNAILHNWSPATGYLNSNAFTDPSGNVGDLGRDAIFGPKFVEHRLLRGEGPEAHGQDQSQLRAEFFNIFNHPNFALPAATSAPRTSASSLRRPMSPRAIPAWVAAARGSSRWPCAFSLRAQFWNERVVTFCQPPPNRGWHFRLRGCTSAGGGFSGESNLLHAHLNQAVRLISNLFF